MPHNVSYELKASEILFSLKAPSGSGLSDSSQTATILGQSRALSALSMGLGIRAHGYNIFIMGAPGTGRRTALSVALKAYHPNPKGFRDIAYVYNFRKVLEPRVLYFPAGHASRFKHDIHDLVENIKQLVLLQDDDPGFSKRRDLLLAKAESAENKRLNAFEKELNESGFKLTQIENAQGKATDLVFSVNGSYLSFDEIQQLFTERKIGAELWNSMREQYFQFISRMNDLFTELRHLRAEVDENIRGLQKEGISKPVSTQIGILKQRYPEEKTQSWLTELQHDMLEHLYFFTSAPAGATAPQRRRRANPLTRYGVNILVDRNGSTEASVVHENRPSLANLVGSIDIQGDQLDDKRTLYLGIRPGSILRAMDGVLVLKAEDIVNDAESWQYLKRVLQTGMLEIQTPPSPFNSPVSLKPEPIQISIKVVLIGDELSYDILYQNDPDFQKLFKVCAEFDSSMERTTETERSYADFLKRYAKDEKLLPLTKEGLSALMEYGVRQAEHRQRLSTRFSLLTDLLREADWWAREQGQKGLDDISVRKALEKRSWMHNLPEARLRQLVLSGDILVNLDGEAVGKANGLAIHDRGYYSFGIPVVVTARVAPGDGGIINIEEASGLSGEIFDKAVLILSGYLRSRYARTFPLSITASVCFEQSYVPIDGDSATAVQLCSIISAISEVPLRQDLALTGSVNQMGDVQPVGGVSEKIEGFHAICALKGLSGSQGVIIPRRNLANLVLSDAVEDDIRKGSFHIYAVDTIDQILEVLTGRNAGALGKDGSFEPDTINCLVSAELKRMANVISSFESKPSACDE